jgi:hypothetical protein
MGEMNMIHAKSHELKNMFKQHYSIYKEVYPHCKNSHKLLLFYAVECGLKCLALQHIKRSSTKYFEQDAKLCKLSGKRGHSIKDLLKFLGVGHFKLTDLYCMNGSKADSSEYNQVWRYGIEVESVSESKNEAELAKIAQWIERRI